MSLSLSAAPSWLIAKYKTILNVFKSIAQLRFIFGQRGVSQNEYHFKFFYILTTGEKFVIFAQIQCS
jgi:hypothetical protein